MLTLSLFAIGPLALQTTQQMTPETSSMFAYADYACLDNSDNRLRYLRTWGWLDLSRSLLRSPFHELRHILAT